MVVVVVGGRMVVAPVEVILSHVAVRARLGLALGRGTKTRRGAGGKAGHLVLPPLLLFLLLPMSAVVASVATSIAVAVAVTVADRVRSRTHRRRSFDGGCGTGLTATTTPAAPAAAASIHQPTVTTRTTSADR